LAQLDEIDTRYFLMVTPSTDIGNIGLSDISKSCDICGEGNSRGRKYRLHLYIKDTYDNASVACFNCDYKANLYTYLRDNHTAEYEMYKREKAGSAFQELRMVDLKKDKKETLDDFDLDEIDTSIVTYEKHKILPKLIDRPKGFIEIPQDALDYLSNRGITPTKDWLYSPKGNKIVFNEANQFLSEFIIIPLKISDKWYGFQALAWKEKKFFVYMVNGNSGFKVENWDNIDKEEPVYITESIYDRLSTFKKNSIAQLGAQLSEERLKELQTPIFCLDNQNTDEASLRESKKYLEQGYKVFIWPDNVPHNIKDFNDLVKLGITKEKITNLIDKNIYQGMKGIVKLKML